MRSRRPLVLACAAVLALLTAKVIAGELATLHRRAEALGPATPVVVARHDLALGATITGDDVEIRRLHEPPPGAVRRSERAAGRRLAVPVLAGSTLLSGHLARRGELVPAGTRVLRVPVQPAWDLAAGAVVDVLAPLDGPGVPGEMADVVTRGAVVLSGSRPSGKKESPLGVENTTAVTLLVTVEAAPRVVSAAAAGPLALALAPPEDACCKTSSSESSRD